MRLKEFITEGDGVSTNNLLYVLQALRSETDQIRVDNLIKMVRKQPGSEMFNVDLLQTAKTNDSRVKNIITDIKNNEDGVPYVYFKQYNDDTSVVPDTADQSALNSVPTTSDQSTVTLMAKRARARRD